jgi:hypothetical protein
MRRARKSPATPLHVALEPASPLTRHVKEGIQALEKTHRDLVDDAAKGEIADSLDLDGALREAHSQEHRWDYLLGHRTTESVVALEPHSGTAADLVAKRKAALTQLRPHLRPRVRIAKWLWVTESSVHHADTERWSRLLDENGIELVGKRVRSKHLPHD